MAKGKILYSDVSDEDVYKLVRQSAAETLTVVNTLTDAIKSSAKGINAGSNGIGNKAEIDALTKSLEDVKRLTEELNILKAKSKEANLLLSKSYDQLSDSEKQVITDSVNISNIRKENLALTKEAIAQSKAEEGSLSQMRTSLNKLIKEYDAMGKARRESIKGTELLDKIKTETLAIYGLETASGRFRRNVGNYTAGDNGLAASINQLTREAPSAAVSMSTFFLAISNNLPQFTDEIKKLKDANVELEASGKPAVSILGQLGKAVLSWQTLISFGITLLTLYGSKLIDYIFDTNKATKSQLDWNKELEKSEKNIDGLVKRIEDANLAIRKSSGTLTIEEENAFKIQREIFAEREKAYNTFIEQQKTLRTELAKARGEDNVSGQLIDAQARMRGNPNFKYGTGFYEYFKGLDSATEAYNRTLAYTTAAQQKLLQEKIDASNAEKIKKQKKEYEDLLKLQQDYYRALQKAQTDNIQDEYQRDSQKIKDNLKFEQEDNIAKYGNNEKSKKLNLELEKKANDDLFKIQQKKIIADEEWNKAKDDRVKKKREEDMKADKERAKIEEAATEEERKRLQAFLDKRQSEEEKARDKAAKDRIKKEQETLNTLQKQSDNYFSRKEKAADMEIQNAKDKQQTLALLAQKGVENAAENYAFEQKAQAEAEEKRLKLERNKMRSEFAISLLKAYSNNGGDLNKTLGDSAALIAAAQALPQFYEGTEDTGTVNKPLDKNGGRLAVIHDNERILNREQNMRLPKGLSNEDLVRQASLMPPSYHSTMTRTNGIEKLESKLDSVVNAINNIEIPEYRLHWDEIEKGFIHTTTKRDRIVRDHQIKRGLF